MSTISLCSFINIRGFTPLDYIAKQHSKTSYGHRVYYDGQKYCKRPLTCATKAAMTETDVTSEKQHMNVALYKQNGYETIVSQLYTGLAKK